MIIDLTVLLSGTLPSEWGEAEYSSPWLRVLMLDNNQLTGTLPRSWRRFVQLRVLGVQGNSLSGGCLGGTASSEASPAVAQRTSVQ